MIGMAVAAGMKAASSIFGGSKSARAIRQMRRNLEAHKQVNLDWYDRRYNEDATQRADAMRLLTMTEENISLKELFDGIVSIMQPQINAKGQHFEVHVDKVEAENVCCDGVRLNQVLLNLLSNATKYTPEGGTIRLSLWEEDSPKGEAFTRVHVAVADNGVGMTPEFQEKIFDAYSRADSARIQKIEGTGLGMTITKYIVDAMGGTIQLQSQVGKGTQFHLSFDFEKAPAAEVNMVLPPGICWWWTTTLSCASPPWRS